MCSFSSSVFSYFDRVSWGCRLRSWCRRPSWPSGSAPRWSGDPVWACPRGGGRSSAGPWSSPTAGSRSCWSGTWSPRSSGGSPPRTPCSARPKGRGPSHSPPGSSALSMNVSLPSGNRRCPRSISISSLSSPPGRTGPGTSRAYTRKYPSKGV